MMPASKRTAYSLPADTANKQSVQYVFFCSKRKNFNNFKTAYKSMTVIGANNYTFLQLIANSGDFRVFQVYENKNRNLSFLNFMRHKN
ncbi:hypothetical protein ATZ36_05575 [Candidatus Endomicrobiellum trichonymphae]|uniref:Uncharacterized protein n=1 Tax=Endomicrobium trichonymphae TaxID=1408204 RepID=A0A1E5II81_ENDTX|nr:hypothetical protein ATZ36_05575 [Candidatus Endomicrobium trichonymphae]